MDELEISGKRYFSAKRIAKENRYHPDYVGQLIRAGRISGTKVGRAWYVDEASFAEYLGKERGTLRSPAVELVTEPTQEPSFEKVLGGPRFPSETLRQTFSQEVPVSASTPVVVVQADPVTIVETAKETTPQAIEKKVPFKTSLTYIPDNSPLFPAIQKRTKPVEIKKDEYIVAQIVKPVHTVQPISRPKRSGWNIGYAVAGVAAVATVFFSFAFFGSLGVNSTVLVEKGKPASVAFAQEKTFCFIFGNCQNGQK